MIVPTLARLLVREHLYRPITGKVLTLGRQTINMTFEEVLKIFKQEGYEPSKAVLEQTVVALDHDTRSGKAVIL